MTHAQYRTGLLSAETEVLLTWKTQNSSWLTEHGTTPNALRTSHHLLKFSPPHVEPVKDPQVKPNEEGPQQGEPDADAHLE